MSGRKFKKKLGMHIVEYVAEMQKKIDSCDLFVSNIMLLLISPNFQFLQSDVPMSNDIIRYIENLQKENKELKLKQTNN